MGSSDDLTFELANVNAIGNAQWREMVDLCSADYKVESAVTNARAVLELRAEFGSFDEYIWGFVCGVPVKNTRASMRDILTITPASERMSRDPKIRGFEFVGPTICYAFMQAAGMVNDHEVTCLRYNQV